MLNRKRMSHASWLFIHSFPHIHVWRQCVPQAYEAYQRGEGALARELKDQVSGWERYGIVHPHIHLALGESTTLTPPSLNSSTSGGGTGPPDPRGVPRGRQGHVQIHQQEQCQPHLCEAIEILMLWFHCMLSAAGYIVEAGLP